MKRLILSIAVLAVLAVPSLASARITPLSMTKAHQVAANRAWSFHPEGGVDSVKSSWCSRWSSWRVDCGGTANGSVYDAEFGFDQSTFCSATVDVFKNRKTGRITTRLESNMFCFGALL
jgi:hypothetical protein